MQDDYNRMTSRSAEDDWENGDDAPKNLRPSAPAFVPRPTQAHASIDAAQRPTPAGIARRPPGSFTAGASGQVDDEDDWFGTRRPAPTNRQLWDSANAAAPPILAPAPSQGSMPTNQIKILRREPAPVKKPTGSSTNAQKTLGEREEEYRLARERIFGKDSTPSASPSSSRGGGNSPQPRVGLDTRPLGPVPTQVKRSPAPSREGTPTGRRKEASGGGKGEQKGVRRQPRGPGSGTGFGKAE